MSNLFGAPRIKAKAEKQALNSAKLGARLFNLSAQKKFLKVEHISQLFKLLLRLRFHSIAVTDPAAKTETKPKQASKFKRFQGTTGYVRQRQENPVSLRATRD